MFEFNPFEVGNPSTLGLAEDIAEQKINDMIADIAQTYGSPVATNIVLEEMEERNIDYIHLPGWLKRKIDDNIDVY